MQLKLKRLPGAPILRRASGVITTWLSALSAREKTGLAVALLFSVFIALYVLSQRISERFQKQNERYQQTLQRLDKLPATLEQHAGLMQRKAAIEARYQEIQFDEDEALPRLEKLIRNTPGVNTDFSLKNNAPENLGEKYKKTSFEVSLLRTNNFAKLVEFFEELVGGSKPFFIERMEIKKTGLGDQLIVSLNVSSIHRK
jgi:hypothetical protein